MHSLPYADIGCTSITTGNKNKKKDENTRHISELAVTETIVRLAAMFKAFVDHGDDPHRLGQWFMRTIMIETELVSLRHKARCERVMCTRVSSISQKEQTRIKGKHF